MPFSIIMDGILATSFEWAQRKNPMGFDIVQNFQTLYFYDLPKLNQFQMPFWRIRKIFD
jgi:hypothetical protein